MSLGIAIFDDNKNIRESVALLVSTDPSLRMVGSFGNVMHCVEECRKCTPNVVLMDIQMPGRDGIEAVKLLKAEFPAMQIMMQTVFEDSDRIFDAICAGASGYILKKDANTKLLEAISDLHKGGSPMSSSIARKVLNKLQLDDREEFKSEIEYNLTMREKDVLLCIVKGLSHKMVAADLNISYETVRSHIKNIYAKLNVASLTEAVAKAIKQNIV